MTQSSRSAQVTRRRGKAKLGVSQEHLSGEDGAAQSQTHVASSFQELRWTFAPCAAGWSQPAMEWPGDAELSAPQSAPRARPHAAKNAAGSGLPAARGVAERLRLGPGLASCGCGSKPTVHHQILVYFSGDWDGHWGYEIFTHGHVMSVC